jgi:HNH endonuclease
MAFSEAVKASVRKKSHLSCCICHAFGVEIHHIIPQAEGGPDSEDNAAPLCPSCHEIYGANSAKRKMITEAREVWYEICATRYAPDVNRVERLIGLLEGATSAFTGFQEFVNRLARPATIAVAAEVQADGLVIDPEAPEIEDDDEASQQQPRSEFEIVEALEEFFDKVWYDRHMLLLQLEDEGKTHTPLDIMQRANEAAERIRLKYGQQDLGPYSDFDWGMLNGRFSALRWVLGDEWDFLDT